MSKEILLVVESVSNEKGISPEVIFDALEVGLAVATKKRYSVEVYIRVAIDRKTGEYKTYRSWEVVSKKDFDNDDMHITIEGLKEKNTGKDFCVGDMYEEQVESIKFGRIAVQLAKQVIVQKVREAERASVVETHRDLLGELINGTVKKVTRDSVIIDLGNNAEALLKKDQTLPRENFRMGMSVRSLLYNILPESDNYGFRLMLSRTTPKMLSELFKLEVPEVSEEIIEIKSVARDPGSRAKIAVKTNDGRIDPVGACVGMGGARVQAVSSELGGERIDIIMYDEDPVKYVINAMQPAEVVSIVIDEDSNSMDIAVDESNLAQAIGRSGQNVRLASDLTGWTINVMTEVEALEKQNKEIKKSKLTFISTLEIGEDIADLLISEGFDTLEILVGVQIEELLSIQGLNEPLINSIRKKAFKALERKKTDKEESNVLSKDLLAMEGMSKKIVIQLSSIGIKTIEDLAEQSVDDLLDIDGFNEELAARFIMTARAPWFEKNK